MLNLRPELFLISSEVRNACTQSEIQATYADMVKIGIANLPYSSVDIGMMAHVYINNKEHMGIVLIDPTDELSEYTYLYECEIKFRYQTNECYQVLIKPDCPTCRDARQKFKSSSSHQHEWLDLSKSEGHYKFSMQCDEIKRLLVVLLATKNIVKTRTKNKLAAMGIGKGKRGNLRPIYTTTLSLPTSLTVDASGKGTSGLTLRPHLRRGHPRHQRYGPGLEFSKEIWVAPCFVNADENFVSERSAYNVGPRMEAAG